MYIWIWFVVWFGFSCDQTAVRTFQSVCPSVRLPVCHTFFTMFLPLYHHESFMSYYHLQKLCPCKISRSEVKGQCHRGGNPIKPIPDYNSSLNSRMVMKWCTKLDVAKERCPIVQVICIISRSQGIKIANFYSDWAFPDCNFSLNSPMAITWCLVVFHGHPSNFKVTHNKKLMIFTQIGGFRTATLVWWLQNDA